MLTIRRWKEESNKEGVIYGGQYHIARFFVLKYNKTMKTKRVIGFFIFAFGSILLPTLGAYLLIYILDIPRATVEDFIGFNLAWVLGGLLGYYLLIIPMWSYFATWASRVEARAGVSAVSKDELIVKILAMNDEKLPWTVRRGEKEDLIAGWKAVDEKWIDIFAANKISLTHKIRINLDEKRGVAHAQDVERKVSWRVGISGRPEATFHWSGSRGITFWQYESGMSFGIIYKDGKLQIGPAYKYTFSLQEMKNPLIEAVTESGWAWKGALTVSPFWRWVFGG